MGDLIERQAVLEGLANIAKAKAKSDAQKSMIGRTMFFVEQLPSVSTEKTGNWYLYEMFANGEAILECSVCHNKHEKPWNYCPNCGAKMVEPQEKEVEE